MKTKIKSVNFHLWEPCNMRCKFCFATFQDVKKAILPKGHLPKEQALEIIKRLADYGFEKITFVGGEPTLCPWLSELIKEAKDHGMTTMIVTNGSKLTEEFLERNKNVLDWITLSIDSQFENTNLKIGRAVFGRIPTTLESYKLLINRIKLYNYRLKINTVVCSENSTESLSEIISFAKPERWKIFQALPVEGQNDSKIDSLLISKSEFESFVERHEHIHAFTKIVVEANEAMTGSYVMIDPAGRFFDNVGGKHRYSDPILAIGIEKAISQVEIDEDKFYKRGGSYNWRNNLPKKITLSGKVASGKSSIGKALAQRLNYQFKSLGNITRSKAEEFGITINEFQEFCKTNSSISISLDNDFSTECNILENVVLDYRLGFKFIEDGFDILLNISDSLALERLANARRERETIETFENRNKLFQEQFEKNYGINYLDERHYDLVLDIDNEKTVDEIVSEIIFKMHQLYNHEQ